MSEKKGWFSRLKDGLKKSTDTITEGITSIFTKKKLDDETLDDLEELLIRSDFGVQTATEVIKQLSKDKFDEEVTDTEIKEVLAEKISEAFQGKDIPLEIDSSKKPHVILTVGVNGSGKTTTLGKLAYQYVQQGKKVRMIAGDTFRAAAVAQLQEWAKRSGAEIEVGGEKVDSAGLIYNSYEKSMKEGDDVLLIDTAGRLQNKGHLMEELSKIDRVLKKLDSSAPHTTLLILDATTGQNAINQVDIFKNTVPLSGLVMTKLDGTAKGGILVNIAQRFPYPIHLIGVGEGIEDLNQFDSEAFSRRLSGL